MVLVSNAIAQFVSAVWAVLESVWILTCGPGVVTCDLWVLGLL